MIYEQIKNRFTGEIICGGLSLKVVLENHIRWRRGESGGSRADLSGADLSGADLYGADLSRANLSRANLSGANLSRANLSRANLSGADLSRANLSGADLYGADLSGVVTAYGYKFTKLPIQLSDKYRIEIWQGFMKIGCEKHLLSDWNKFSQRRILEMDGKSALVWWKKWKPALFALAEAGDRIDLPKQEDLT